jgi:hypothetical protein
VVSRDSGALPQRQQLHAICEAVGLDDRDAVLLHTRSNAVHHLPREDLVLRVATATPPQLERAHTVVAVRRWLAEHHGPTLAPTDLPQPVIAPATVATVWPYLPPSHPPDPVALGAALRDLHAITTPPPPVPTYQPLARLDEALELDATRDTPALNTEQHTCSPTTPTASVPPTEA